MRKSNLGGALHRPFFEIGECRFCAILEAFLAKAYPAVGAAHFEGGASERYCTSPLVSRINAVSRFICSSSSRVSAKPPSTSALATAAADGKPV